MNDIYQAVVLWLLKQLLKCGEVHACRLKGDLVIACYPQKLSEETLKRLKDVWRSAFEEGAPTLAIFDEGVKVTVI